MGIQTPILPFTIPDSAAAVCARAHGRVGGGPLRPRGALGAVAVPLDRPLAPGAAPPTPSPPSVFGSVLCRGPPPGIRWVQYCDYADGTLWEPVTHAHPAARRASCGGRSGGGGAQAAVADGPGDTPPRGPTTGLCRCGGVSAGRKPVLLFETKFLQGCLKAYVVRIKTISLWSFLPDASLNNFRHKPCNQILREATAEWNGHRKF